MHIPYPCTRIAIFITQPSQNIYNHPNSSSSFIFWLLAMDMSLRWAWLSSMFSFWGSFFLYMLKSPASLSESAAFFSHQKKKSYSSNYVRTQMKTNI